MSEWDCGCGESDCPFREERETELRSAARALLDALPRCEGWADPNTECTEIAVYAYEGIPCACEAHFAGMYARTPLPYAAAVRALREVLG